MTTSNPVSSLEPLAAFAVNGSSSSVLSVFSVVNSFSFASLPRRKHFGELHVPVEDVDPGALLFVEEVDLLALVEIGADEGVAALDVAAEVGQGALVEELEVWLERSARSRLRGP